MGQSFKMLLKQQLKKNGQNPFSLQLTLKLEKCCEESNTLSALVSLAKAFLPANPLKAYWNAIISLISLSYCYKAKFDKATLPQMLQPITFRM